MLRVILKLSAVLKLGAVLRPGVLLTAIVGLGLACGAVAASTTPSPATPSPATPSSATPRATPNKLTAAKQAVWLRPPETPEALIALLDATAKAGFSDVMLESFYHGRTIYPSLVAPNRFDIDMLELARARCAFLGMKLHAWLEVLYWSPGPTYLTQSELWLNHQDWDTRDATNRSSKSNTGMGFVDPAIPDVRALVIDLARELGEHYPDVGLHLDYLRYPRDTQYGFHPVALEAFRLETGKTPADPSAWTTWRAWRITSLAGEMINAYHAAGGRALVSAAVQPLPPRLGGEPLQDWESWPGLEVAIPMAYTQSNLLIELAARTLNFAVRGPVRWLGVLTGPGYPTLADQIDLARRTGVPGLAVFGWVP